MTRNSCEWLCLAELSSWYLRKILQMHNFVILTKVSSESNSFYCLYLDKRICSLFDTLECVHLIFILTKHSNIQEQVFRQNCHFLKDNCHKHYFFLQDNGSPEEHAIYVWDHFISQSAAENVFFVAHSYGGLAFVELVSVNSQLLSFLETITDFYILCDHLIESSQVETTASGHVQVGQDFFAARRSLHLFQF